MTETSELDDLKRFLLETIEEYMTPQAIPLAKRWEGGSLILKPNNETQAKEIPLEVFFKKIFSIRDALRVLEQKLNAHPGLDQADKVTFQSYITKAYGTLTTFNILFKEDKHKFVGSGSGGDRDDEGEEKPKMTITQMRKKIGLNEY